MSQEIDIFGGKLRINTQDEKYIKTDGTAGTAPKGINISIGSGWIRPTPLQMAAIIKAFDVGTQARKDLIALVKEQKEEQNNINL